MEAGGPLPAVSPENGQEFVTGKAVRVTAAGADNTLGAGRIYGAVRTL